MLTRFFVAFAIAIASLGWATPAFASSCPVPSCVVNTFGMEVIMGTLEVETPGGTVVYTANDLYSSNGPIPDDLASQIETDSGVPSYIQNNIGLLAGANDFDFIEEPAADFPPILLGVNGSVSAAASDGFTAVQSDLESIALAPVTGVSSNLVYLDQYLIEGLNSDLSVQAEGILSVSFYDDVVVETETTATPEPRSALILGCIVLALALFRRVRAWRLGRSLGCLAVLAVFSNCAPRAVASTCSPPSCQIINDSFTIDAIMGTLEVETTGGTVVYTANDLYVSSMIPDDLASQIEADSGVPTYIENNIGLLAGSNDFDFLTGAGDIPSLLASVDGSVAPVTGDGFTVVQNDLESISLAPVTSVTPSFLYNDQYLIDAFNTNLSEEAVGIVNVDFYNDMVVETETAATPEPRTALILACIVLALALFRRVRASRLGRSLGCLAVLAVFSNCVPRAVASTCSPPSCTTITTAFNVDVVMGTLEVESANGTVLSDTNDLWVSNAPIPEDLATQIETDLGVPAYIQNSIGLLAGSNDFDYITEPAGDFPPILASVNGSVASAPECSTAPTFPACPLVENDLESIALAPVTSVTSTFVFSDQYLISGYNSDDTEWAIAAITVNFADDVVVETETAATPEPRTAPILACGVLGLALFQMRTASTRRRSSGRDRARGPNTGCPLSDGTDR